MTTNERESPEQNIRIIYKDQNITVPESHPFVRDASHYGVTILSEYCQKHHAYDCTKHVLVHAAEQDSEAMMKAGAYLPPGELRAGEHDKHQTLNRLTQAKVEGRLDAAQYDARIEHVRLAQSQADLRCLVRDLPEGSASTPLLSRNASKAVALQFAILLFAFCTIGIPYLTIHGGPWASMWEIFPFVGIILSVVGEVGWFIECID